MALSRKPLNLSLTEPFGVGPDLCSTLESDLLVLLKAALSDRLSLQERGVCAEVLLGLNEGRVSPLERADDTQLSHVTKVSVIKAQQAYFKLPYKPDSYFVDGVKLFREVLPGYVRHPSQQAVLRAVMALYGLKRKDLALEMGCSVRTLDKWLLPDTSKDFRSMGTTAKALIANLRARGSASFMPDNTELTMGLATKAFKLIDRDRFIVSASLSVSDPEGLKNFGEFQSILLMAYNEGLQSALGKLGARPC